MNANVCAYIAVLSLIAFSANALECDQSIVDKILNSENCPNDVLQKMHGLSPITTAALNKPDLGDLGNPEDFKCFVVQNQAPVDKKANANFTIYFKNGPTTLVRFLQEEVKCGNMVQTYDTGKKFQVFFLNIDKVACYYRCSLPTTEGTASAGCLVPVAHQKDPEVLAQVAACKESLVAAGFTEPLTDTDTCDV